MADKDGLDHGTILALYEEYVNNMDGTGTRINSFYLIGAYLAAIITANLLVAKFGPSISILNAFLFIGLDLTTRDYLHELWQANLWPKMLLLISTGSLLSYLLNKDTGPIAVASFMAFAGAGLVDTFIYYSLGGWSRMIKINGSNIIASGVDSFLFPLLAFGFPLLWFVIVGQFVSKVVGGFVWSLLISNSRKVEQIF